MSNECRHDTHRLTGVGARLAPPRVSCESGLTHISDIIADMYPGLIGNISFQGCFRPEEASELRSNNVRLRSVTPNT